MFTWYLSESSKSTVAASPHLSDELTARQPKIPWRKTAGIGNVLRHEDGSMAAPIIWKFGADDLPALEKAGRQEFWQP